jgi:hypothetical protein
VAARRPHCPGFFHRRRQRGHSVDRSRSTPRPSDGQGHVDGVRGVPARAHSRSRIRSGRAAFRPMARFVSAHGWSRPPSRLLVRSTLARDAAQVRATPPRSRAPPRSHRFRVHRALLADVLTGERAAGRLDACLRSDDAAALPARVRAARVDGRCTRRLRFGYGHRLAAECATGRAPRRHADREDSARCLRSQRARARRLDHRRARDARLLHRLPSDHARCDGPRELQSIGLCDGEHGTGRGHGRIPSRRRNDGGQRGSVEPRWRRLHRPNRVGPTVGADSRRRRDGIAGGTGLPNPAASGAASSPISDLW